MFVIKSMKAGKVTTVELPTVEKLIPIVIATQKRGVPFYVLSDDKVIGKGNLDRVEAEKEDPNAWTLRVKDMNKDGKVKTTKYFDLNKLSIDVMFANKLGNPWYVLDKHGKVWRKGNIDKLPGSTPASDPAPAAGNDTIDEAPPEAEPVDVSAPVQYDVSTDTSAPVQCDTPDDVPEGVFTVDDLGNDIPIIEEDPA